MNVREMVSQTGLKTIKDNFKHKRTYTGKRGMSHVHIHFIIIKVPFDPSLLSRS